MTTSSPAKVIQLLAAGQTVRETADATTWPTRQIVQLAGKHGWLIHAETGRAYDPAGKPLKVPPVFQQPQQPVRDGGRLPSRVPPTQQAPEGESRPRNGSVDELLERALKADAPKLQTAVKRVSAAVADLRARLDEHERTDKERRAATAEIQRLEQELADARWRARELGVTRTKPTAAAAGNGTPGGARARGLDPARVREWADAQGVDCPRTRRIPNQVLDAYEAAHSGGGKD